MQCEHCQHRLGVQHVSPFGTWDVAYGFPCMPSASLICRPPLSPSAASFCSTCHATSTCLYYTVCVPGGFTHATCTSLTYSPNIYPPAAQPRCILAELLGGRPVFPGTSTMNQLDRILEITGKPSKEDVDAIQSDFAATMLDNLPTPNQVSLLQAGPSACPVPPRAMLTWPSELSLAIRSTTKDRIYRFVDRVRGHPGQLNRGLVARSYPHTLLAACDWCHKMVNALVLHQRHACLVATSLLLVTSHRVVRVVHFLIRCTTPPA